MRKAFPRRTLTAIALALLIAPGCGKGEGPDPTIARLTWETRGGGNLAFSVVPDAPGYRIDVDQANFQAIDLSIDLDPEDGSAFTLAQDIFEGRVDVNDHTFIPEGTTGTWTSITLDYTNGEPVKVENIDMSSNMRTLYEFVRTSIESP